ncbi:MAG TPA: GNAT family N-acetyltransferase [Acidimicrobiales bacterium]|nr:GNAT family N-acetyltransferase [Acidimicrobiales bacterium]
MASLRVEHTDDAATAMAVAGDYLAADPVGLNVIWSIMSQRADSGAPGRYWLASRGGAVVGIVMESPPGHHAAIAPMPRECGDELAAAISEEGHRLSGAAGEAFATSAFAGAWVERVRAAAIPFDAQRLYALGRLVLPEAVPGNLRRADPSERKQIIEWWAAFQVETGLPEDDVSPAVDLGLSTGRLFVWDDAGARCVARVTEPLGGVSRIGAVFTPSRWRRRGYAAACVGALCDWVRREDRANSILYAQLGNPSSNGIYRRLGFRPVSEVLAYRFSDVTDGE